ncbi:hypothetical protein BU25DRAFT_408448 [Macroventuria anomochaeta]|uniref:Uncharacterized protein n=1 Tax=Macroventuria anomochaeta TaxID=301207 RepID=A0ACB6S8F1_9PLEO|nr:uncharacterized protein BU25DRAFT_408448 [Macroventuria anomochaeta]KAF2630530.1 hypothetical protein BU25DRAFT_408448 [Macroventuria anomochaeta]
MAGALGGWKRDLCQYFTTSRPTQGVAQQHETPSPIYHGPSSKRLSKMRASKYSQSSQASSSTSTSYSQTGSQASSAICLHSPEIAPPTPGSPSLIPRTVPTHNYPSADNKLEVKGVEFDVDFNHVYVRGTRL